MKFRSFLVAAGILGWVPIASAQGAAPGVRAGVELETGGAFEHLSNDIAAWSEAFVRLRILPRPGSAVGAEVMQVERFGFRDTQARFSANTRFGQKWTGSAEIAGAPGATVLPDFAVLGNVYRDLGSGFQAGIGGRHSTYETGPVSVATGSLDYYLPDTRIGYVVFVGFVDGETAPSHAGSLSRYYGSNSSFNVVVSNGESVERVDAARLLVSRTRGGAVWGVHWLSAHFAGTYAVEFNRQEDIFDRTRVQLGMRARIR